MSKVNGILAISLTALIALSVTVWALWPDRVYVTMTGGKYHTRDCRYVEDHYKVEKMTINQAKALDLEPCEVCQP